MPTAFHRRLRVAAVLAAVGFTALATTVRADKWAPNLTAGGTWHSNATLADRSSDQIESLQLSADILAGERYPVGRDDALHLTGHLAGDWWPRYRDLTRGAAGGRAEWRHQFGPDPRAPVIAVEGSADFVEAGESARRGFATGVAASVRKRFNDFTRATLRHEVAWFNARYATFDSAASETSLELDRDLTPKTRLTFAARFRDGDIVTYATGLRPDLVDRAPNRMELDTFDRPMTAYRIDATTWSGRAALVRALDDSSAIIVSYEYRNTIRGPLRFPNHLLSVALVHQF
jgi:hypothetical protein